MYKQVVYDKGHLLANKNGVVRKSRYVLFKKLEGNPGDCNWCQIKLSWKTLCADHLDSNIMNDVPENLVGSCRGCNANREDGTGHGRKKPKTCAECEELFISKHHHKRAIYCSNRCASKNRPKRGITSSHGTRSRYVAGCRCGLCHESNLAYSRMLYNKKSASSHCWNK